MGMPVCPCGATMRPCSPADLAFCGLIDQDDMPAIQWTAICRENGWEDSIQRRGAAAKSYARKLDAAGGILGRVRGADHCANPGCGRWIADGVDRCSAGHAQSANVVELEAIKSALDLVEPGARIVLLVG